jgi:hypothetical protein
MNIRNTALVNEIHLALRSNLGWQHARYNANYYSGVGI